MRFLQGFTGHMAPNEPDVGGSAALRRLADGVMRSVADFDGPGLLVHVTRSAHGHPSGGQCHTSPSGMVLLAGDDNRFVKTLHVSDKLQ